jgi:hypothetical protein
MFDLSLAQVSHPDRERDLNADLDRRRLLKDAAGTPVAEPQRAPRSSPTLTTTSRVTTGR